MPREAELADGTVLEFPDETTDEVIRATVKKHLGSAASAMPTPAGDIKPPPLTPEGYVAGLTGEGAGKFLRDAAPIAGGLIAPLLIGPAGLPATAAAVGLGAAGGEGIKRGAEQLTSGKPDENVAPAMLKEGAIQGGTALGMGLAAKPLTAAAEALAGSAVGSPGSLYGQNAGRGMVKANLTAASQRALLPKIQEVKTAVREGIADSLKAVNKVVDLSTPLKGAIAEGRNIMDLAAKTTDPDLYMRLATAIAKPKLNPFEANQLRTDLQSLASYTKDKVAGAGGKRLNTILKGAAAQVGQAVEAAVPGTQAQVSHLGDLILAEDGLKKSILSGAKSTFLPHWLFYSALTGLAHFNPKMALTAMGVRGLAGAMGSVPGKTGTALALKGLASPPLRQGVTAAASLTNADEGEPPITLPPVSR
jgi:hypothetical protein